MALSAVYRSCDRLLIGKTYWKSVVQPSVLSASLVVVWSRQEKAKLQVVENRVWVHQCIYCRSASPESFNPINNALLLYTMRENA